MIRIPKSVVSFGALALAAGVLTLAVPRAAHAVAAALVEVTNTAANPAIIQDTSRQASQLVTVNCQSYEGNLSSCGVNNEMPQYTVPPNQSLVITSVEFYQGGSAYNQLFLNDNHTNTGYHTWSFSGTNSFQFQYPSGIVFPSGAQPGVNGFDDVINVTMSGYLTNN